MKLLRLRIAAGLLIILFLLSMLTPAFKVGGAYPVFQVMTALVFGWIPAGARLLHAWSQAAASAQWFLLTLLILVAGTPIRELASRLLRG